MAEDDTRNARRRTEDAVRALYRILLLRDPNPNGLEHYADMVLSGRLTLPSLVGRICRSDEFGSNLGNFVARYGKNDGRTFGVDGSQHGEARLLTREIVNGSCRHRIVVDVGVLGRRGSNSYDLLRGFGWKGLLIEANPHLIPKIAEEFAGLDIALVNCAVSDYSGTARLYLGATDGVSSLGLQRARSWGPIRGDVEVRVRRLAEILMEHSIPPDFELLSLDIEGEDIKVMNDLIANSAFRPRWAIIEASHDLKTKSLTDLPLVAAVIDAYEMFGQTKANLLLRRRAG